MLLLLVCRRLLLHHFVADVLERLTPSSQSPLFFFDGEIKFPFELICFLPLFGQLLLQSLTHFLENCFYFPYSEENTFRPKLLKDNIHNRLAYFLRHYKKSKSVPSEKYLSGLIFF